jgi:hypothetical protein
MGDEDRRHDRPFGRSRSDQQIDQHGDYDDADNRQLTWQLQPLQERRTFDSAEAADSNALRDAPVPAWFRSSSVGIGSARLYALNYAIPQSPKTISKPFLGNA